MCGQTVRCRSRDTQVFHGEAFPSGRAGPLAIMYVAAGDGCCLFWYGTTLACLIREAYATDGFVRTALRVADAGCHQQHHHEEEHHSLRRPPDAQTTLTANGAHKSVENGHTQAPVNSNANRAQRASNLRCKVQTGT